MPGMGGGQDSADTRWDMYQARDTSPFMGPTQKEPQNQYSQPPVGAGGERGMGAGGVYVKYPDGSAHWDETRPDPSDSGGSVIDSSTGKAIPGADRQSYSVGPGGTGPAGSQAREAHIGELMSNPTFASDPGNLGLWSGTTPAEQSTSLWGNPQKENNVDPFQSSVQQPGVRTRAQLGLPGTGTVGAGGEGGMGAGATNVTIGGKTYDLSTQSGRADARTDNPGTIVDANSAYNPQTGQQTGGDGGGGGGGGGGGNQNGTGYIGITPSQQGQIDNLNRQVDEKIRSDQANEAQAKQSEDNRHAEALAKIDQDWAIHQDEDRRQQEINAETTRHNEAAEQLQRDQMTHETELEQMKEANAVQLQQMQEGNAIYLQQGDQAFKSWQANQTARMSILSSALQNPWLQKLSGMTPGPGYQGSAVGGKNISGLINQILQPYDPTAWGAQNAPSAAGLGGSTAGGPGASGANAQPSGADMGFSSNTPSGGAQGQPVDWNQWQSWDPFQKAAYRTDIESEGPGAWASAGDQMAQGFVQQGGTPNVTAMQSAASNPAGRAGMEMTADLFGQDPTSFWNQQNKQWSQAQAPTVKQSFTSGIAA